MKSCTFNKCSNMQTMVATYLRKSVSLCSLRVWVALSGGFHLDLPRVSNRAILSPFTAFFIKTLLLNTNSES